MSVSNGGWSRFDQCGSFPGSLTWQLPAATHTYPTCEPVGRAEFGSHPRLELSSNQVAATTTQSSDGASDPPTNLNLCHLGEPLMARIRRLRRTASLSRCPASLAWTPSNRVEGIRSKRARILLIWCSEDCQDECSKN